MRSGCRGQRWKMAAWIFTLALSKTFADPFVLVGGKNNSNPYASYVNSSALSEILLSLTNGQINSVALIPSGQGLIGGVQNTNHPYAAFVSPGSPALATPLNLGVSTGSVNSVSLQSSGQGIIGGQILTAGYAAFVNTPSTLTPITLGITGTISTVQLAPSANLGVIGGQSGSAGYAAFVQPISAAASVITQLPVTGSIQRVSVNDGGIALLGGTSSGNLYAAFVNFVNPSLVASSVIFPGTHAGQINSVVINACDVGLIGGRDTTHSLAYASFVRPLEAASNLLSFNGTISAVSLNNTGQGLIGGQQNGGAPYAAFVSQKGTPLSQITLGFTSGDIDTAVINQFGQGLIGGQNGGAGYVALVDFNYPSHLPIVISGFPSSGDILSLSYVISPIPTDSLHGNNAAFAKYINENAPRELFYLYPSVFDGSFADALESAIPTRNAASLFTAEVNMFVLTHGFSSHLRNERHFKQLFSSDFSSSQTAVNFSEETETEELVAFGQLGRSKLGFGKKQHDLADAASKKCTKEASASIWFEAIGALAYQKAQSQTPAFDPKIAGGILAFDVQASDASQAGLGLAYTYTQIHEHQSAGSSHSNQEYAFLYMTTSDERWYFDFAFWGGLFQIDQVRKIAMTEWNFQSKSKPNGWQINPHIEMGYDYVGRNSCTRETELIVNVFVMADWVNAWQESYREKGNSPFNAGQKSHYSSTARVEGGLRFYEPIFFETWSLTFEEKFSYVSRTPRNVGRMQAFLVGAPGSFAVETLNNQENLGVVELSAIFASNGPLGSYGSITYQGELNGSYQLHQLVLEVSYNF